MELKNIYKNLSGIIVKYKYVILVVIVGIILMALPVGNKKGEQNISTVKTVDDRPINEELSEILSFIDGVGEVRVFLTEARGTETLYQTNEDHSTGNDNNSLNIDTVTVTDGQRNQTGLVKQINPPKYLGAIIICSGGDNSQVRLEVTNAVAKVTGLSTNQISVLKMK